jgi:hypothetical protein
MRTSQMVLGISLVAVSSPAFGQAPNAGWPDAGNPAVQQTTQQNRWHDRNGHQRGYWASDYSCPEQPTIVGVPVPTAAPQRAPREINNPAAATVSNADSASMAPRYSNQDAHQVMNQDSVPAPTPVAGPAASQPYAVLTCGTFVRLEFVSALSSKTAQVGDPIALRLTEEIRVGNTVIVPKGTPAGGTITFVRRTGPGGMPGALTYELGTLRVNGIGVPLWRSEGRSGDPKIPGAEALIPVAGVFTLFRHGKDAEIKSGMPLTALVAADSTIALPQ